MSSRLSLAVLLILAPLSACFCDQPVTPDPGEDAGLDAGPLDADAGPVDEDAGPVLVDAGAGDAGAPLLDGGPAPVDGGQDAGVCANAVSGDIVINDAADLAALLDVDCIFGSLIISNTTLANLDGLESLTLITGDLIITGNDDLVDLDGLSGLTEIGGDFALGDDPALTSVNLSALEFIGGTFEMQNTAVTDLDALSALGSVGGVLNLGNNANLTSVTGLVGVVSVGGLNLEGNPSLSSFDGLENIGPVIDGDVTIGLNGDPVDYAALTGLTVVSGQLRLLLAPFVNLAFLANLETVGTLRLEQVATLPTLDDLQALTSVGDLLLQQNTGLTTLGTGLEQLSALAGDLEIISCPALSDITALDGVVSVGGNFGIQQTGLVDTAGFASLVDVGGDFDFSDNDAATTLSGFDNLATVGGTFFRIFDNLSLPQVEAQALLDRLIAGAGYDDVAGTEVVVNNDG